MKPLALTAAMLAFACAVTIALAQDDPAPEPAPEPKPAKELTQAEKDALATRAYFVLRNRCWGCHGEPGKTAFGETVALDWILDYDKLVAAKLVIPGKVKESRLIYLTTLGKMPREFDAEGKPSKEGELPEAEQKALVDWVKAGAPKWPKVEYEMEWVPIGPGPIEPDPRIRTYMLFEGTQGKPSVLVWDEAGPMGEVWEFSQNSWRSVCRDDFSGAHAFGVRESPHKRTIFLAADMKWPDRLRVLHWDGVEFKSSYPDPAPSGYIVNYGLAFDLEAKRTVMFGGRRSGLPVGPKGESIDDPLNECWAYKDGQFEKIASGVTPPAYRNPAFGYDVSGKRCILLTRSVEHTQTWQLTGTEWKQLQPKHSPVLGTDHDNLWPRMVWDGSGSRLVLHGPDNFQSETWAWADGEWKLLTKAVPPRGGIRASIAWDPEGKRMIYYQGGDGVGAGAETWALIPWRKAK